MHCYAVLEYQKRVNLEESHGKAIDAGLRDIPVTSAVTELSHAWLVIG